MQTHKISKMSLETWVENPISKVFFERLAYLLMTDKRSLETSLNNTVNISDPEFLHVLSQLKGKINTLEQVLNIEEFLYYDTIQEEIDDVHSSRSENQS